MLFFGDTQEPLSRNRIATDQPHWSWADALAAARPGARYRIRDIVFSMVHEHCEALDLHRGDELLCLRNQRWALELKRPDGRRVHLERDFAWFVQVEPVEPVEQSGTVSGDASLTS